MCLFDLRPGILPALYHLLELAELFLNFAGGIAVRPEIGRQGLPFEPLNFFFFPR